MLYLRGVKSLLRWVKRVVEGILDVVFDLKEVRVRFEKNVVWVWKYVKGDW